MVILGTKIDEFLQKMIKCLKVSQHTMLTSIGFFLVSYDLKLGRKFYGKGQISSFLKTRFKKIHDREFAITCNIQSLFNMQLLCNTLNLSIRDFEISLTSHFQAVFAIICNHFLQSLSAIICNHFLQSVYAIIFCNCILQLLFAICNHLQFLFAITFFNL